MKARSASVTETASISTAFLGRLFGGQKNLNHGVVVLAERVPSSDFLDRARYRLNNSNLGR